MRVRQNEEMRGSAKAGPMKSFKAPAELNPPAFKSGGNLPAIEDSEEESPLPSNKGNLGFPTLSGMAGNNAAKENQNLANKAK